MMRYTRITIKKWHAKLDMKQTLEADPCFPFFLLFCYAFLLRIVTNSLKTRDMMYMWGGSEPNQTQIKPNKMKREKDGKDEEYHQTR